MVRSPRTHEERIRGIIVMQADGDRSPMVAEMRRDLEAQVYEERSALGARRAQRGGQGADPPAPASSGSAL